MLTRIVLTSLLALLTGCASPADRVPATCGMAALVGATSLLEQFTVPDQTLAAPPASLPERVVVRIVADGAFPAVIGRTESGMVIGMQGSPPATATPGFGVLVADTREKVIGVMLYEGDPIPGAPILGEVSVGEASIPLIGVQTDPAKFMDPSCPTLFPDSIIQ